MKKFIILSQSRSGSTLLRRILNSEPRICCHGEVYNPYKPFGYALKKKFPGHDLSADNQKIIRKRLGYESYMNQYIFPSFDGLEAMGFKVLYPHLETPKLGKFLLDFISDNRDLKIIRLRREDQLARYISDRIKVKKIDPTKRTRIWKWGFDRYMRDSIKNYDTYWSMFPNHHTLDFSYEDLVSDFDSSFNRLSGFLDIEECKFKIEQEKSPAVDYEMAIKNYSLIKAHNETRYSDFAEKMRSQF